jgi:predicted Rossmann-fold nucleotide-binding protein
MPGGFGTMDEIFEILTLVQCQKMPKVPIVLYGKDYWNSILNLQAFADHGVISEEDLNLFKICDTPSEALEYLTKNMELV